MPPSHDPIPGASDPEPDAGPGVDEPQQADGGPLRELTDRELQVLDFERQWWRHAGSKEQAIRERFGFSPTRYYQVLNTLLDSPAALAYDAALVKRLRRLRASRSRARSVNRSRVDQS